MSQKGNEKLAQKRERKRQEAEERNAAYQKLSFEEKLTHHKDGGKVYNKLIAQKEKQEQEAAVNEKKKEKK